MRAAVVHSFSAPPRCESFADPVPTGDEVLVTVAAAGLHPIVKSLANGTHYGAGRDLPFIPGLDGVGCLPDGARVYFGRTRPLLGTMAERCITMRAACFPVPDSLDDATVAAIMNPGLSSWGALTERTRLAPGENVLILGATGVAGRLAVQVAKRLGARRVVAAGRNPASLAELEALGADAVLSVAQERPALVAAFQDALHQNHIDIVLDYLWGAPAEALLEAITQKGLDHAAGRLRYLQVGSSAGPTLSLAAESLRSSGLELMGSGFGSVSMERIFRALRLFLDQAAQQPFHIQTAVAPLAHVESLWNTPERGARLVFQP